MTRRFFIQLLKSTALIIIWVGIGIVVGIAFVLGLIGLPFVALWHVLPRKWTGRVVLDPEDVAQFQRLYAALVANDIALLAAEAKATPDFPFGEDGATGRSWLITAIDVGNLASVVWILDQGVSPDFYDSDGQSPLVSAMNHDFERARDLMRLLLDRGASVNEQDRLGATPLHVACLRGDIDMARLLLDLGADPLIQDREHGAHRPIDLVKARKFPELYALLSDAMTETSSARKL